MLQHVAPRHYSTLASEMKSEDVLQSSGYHNRRRLVYDSIMLRAWWNHAEDAAILVSDQSTALPQDLSHVPPFLQNGTEQMSLSEDIVEIPNRYICSKDIVIQSIISKEMLGRLFSMYLCVIS